LPNLRHHEATDDRAPNKQGRDRQGANGTDHRPLSTEAPVVNPAMKGPVEAASVLNLSGGRHCVRGRVTTTSNDPLPGASLTLVNANGNEVGHALTGRDGSFVVSAVTPGTYTLVAAAPNFRAGANMVTVRASDATATVSLYGVGWLAGKVTRVKDGSPLLAQLELLSPNAGVVTQCTCGQDGAFSVPDVLEGDYELSVQAPGYRSAKVPVTIRRGAIQTALVSLVGLGHLYGTVSAPGGAWLPGVAVTLTDSSGPVARTSTDDAGSYHFSGVPEGSYMVSVPGSGTPATRIDIGVGTAMAADLMLEAR
jgi:protocatechuate 3,4-dioxygenase beta subunit